MNYLQRDILVIPVPFTDLSTSKRRPVLVISSTVHNAKTPDIVVAAVTSNGSSPFGGVVIDSPDMEMGSLPHLSMVRPDKLYTLSQSIVVRHVGQLDTSKFDQLLTELDAVLDR